jgi:hypothetical protein
MSVRRRHPGTSRLRHAQGTSATAQAAAQHAQPGTPSTAQARYTPQARPDMPASRRHRHAQEGQPGTLKHAQAGARLRHAQCSTTAQARSGRFRQAQTRSDAQTRSETQTAQICRVLRHAPYGSSTLAWQAQDGTTHQTRSDSRHAQEGSNSRLRHPQAQAGGQAGSSGQSGRLEEQSCNCRKRLVSFRPDHMPRPKMINSSLRSPSVDI